MSAEGPQEMQGRLEELLARKSQLLSELDQINREIAEIEGASTASGRFNEYPRIVTELPGVAERQREVLLRLAGLAGNKTVLSTEVFKNQRYLCVDIGTHTFTFNSLQLDQTERVAKLLKEKLLTSTRAFSAVIRANSSLVGVKLQVVIALSGLQAYAAIFGTKLDRKWIQR